MTLARETLLELMAYADGELDASERPRIEALIASDGEAARVVASFVRVGEWARVADEEREVPAADSIADLVMARLDATGGVVNLAAERAKRAARLRMSAAVIAVAAIAASYFFVTQRSDVSPGAQVNAASSPIASAVGNAPLDVPSPVKTADPSTAPSDAVAQGVEVGKIDSPSKDVSVFYLPAGSGDNGARSSVVIWIGDDQAGGSKK